MFNKRVFNEKTMEFEKKIIKENKKTLTLYKFNFNKKDYKITFSGTGRRPLANLLQAFF